MTRVAILDRDGTIIDVVRDEETGVVAVAFHPDHVRFLPGAIEGMRALQEGGYALAMATNQPGPAKGQISAQAVARTNQAVVSRLAEHGVRVQTVEVCMHHPDGGPGGDSTLVRRCDCRKPKPGMLHAIAERLGADRMRSWMIGDSSGDVQAGRAAGFRTGLVFAPNRCELCPLRNGVSGIVPDAFAARLDELASSILAQQ